MDVNPALQELTKRLGNQFELGPVVHGQIHLVLFNERNLRLLKWSVSGETAPSSATTQERYTFLRLL
jgi:hypothetical protein